MVAPPSAIAPPISSLSSPVRSPSATPRSPRSSRGSPSRSARTTRKRSRATPARSTRTLSSSDLDLPASAELIDQMVAEERRIYERAMEREQRLFDLESTVRELRSAASDLARAAELMNGGQSAAPRELRAPEVLGSARAK